VIISFRCGGARCLACVQVVLLALCIVVAGSAPATQPPAGAAIASAHPLATEAGYRILRQGGNAFDAAVAVAAALAVVEPYSSGLGGGGFWLLHRAADSRQVMIDARETAPAAVVLSMYLDADGRPISGATLQGGKAAAIPGAPAGMTHLAQRYGKLPLAQSLAPGIALADKQATTRTLLQSGATIHEMNCVRKHLSAIKGGRLAAATPARLLTLAISDVVGDDPSVIGSGPAVPDPAPSPRRARS
jgi:hypothetical protein